MAIAVQDLLKTHPNPTEHVEGVQRAVDHILRCAEACSVCADSCLGEESVSKMAACIRTDLDCADVCHVTARVLVRQTAQDWRLARTLLGACARACSICAEECEQHSHEHCRACAQACRECEAVCTDLLDELPAKA